MTNDQVSRLLATFSLALKYPLRSWKDTWSTNTEYVVEATDLGHAAPPTKLLIRDARAANPEDSILITLDITAGVELDPDHLDQYPDGPILDWRVYDLESYVEACNSYSDEESYTSPYNDFDDSLLETGLFWVPETEPFVFYVTSIAL